MGPPGLLPPPPLFIRYLQRSAQSQARQSAHLLPTIFDFGFGVPQCESVDTGRLPVPGSPDTVLDVRFLAILLVAVLLPLSFSVPPVMACSTTDCCGANCSPSAPVSQLNCCKAPIAPDRAALQAQDAHHFDSAATMPVARTIVAISHLQNTIVARGYPPPDRPASLALLCSRQI